MFDGLRSRPAARPRRGRGMDLASSTRGVPLGGECLDYSGLLITRTLHGRAVAEEWIPLGDDPGETDDEQVLRSLRAALLWTYDSVAG